MVRDRSAPVDLFALAPQVALVVEPVLARLDALLDDDTLCGAVKAESARHWPKTLVTGRPSPPVEGVLRLLVIRRLYGRSDAELERVVSDSLVQRQFCRLGLEWAPDDTTLIRRTALFRPETLDALLDDVGTLARQLKCFARARIRACRRPRRAQDGHARGYGTPAPAGVSGAISVAPRLTVPRPPTASDRFLTVPPIPAIANLRRGVSPAGNRDCVRAGPLRWQG